VARVARLPLEHQPGRGWLNGRSYDVSARLVEVFSGSSFEAFLQGHIFAPLEMVDTGFTEPAPARDWLAVVYTIGGQGTLQAVPASALHYEVLKPAPLPLGRLRPS